MYILEKQFCVSLNVFHTLLLVFHDLCHSLFDFNGLRNQNVAYFVLDHFQQRHSKERSLKNMICIYQMTYKLQISWLEKVVCGCDGYFDHTLIFILSNFLPLCRRTIKVEKLIVALWITIEFLLQYCCSLSKIMRNHIYHKKGTYD